MSSVMNWASGPAWPTGVRLMVGMRLRGYTPARAVPPQSTTTAAISLSGGGARNPSMTSAPVRSAILWATSGMPPPVTATILSFSAVGWITSGPPHPWGPRSILTALNVFPCISRLPLQLHALAPGQEEGHVLRHYPPDEDDDQARDYVPDRQRPEREIELLYPPCHAEPDKELGRVDVREDPERRMHEGDRRVVEGGLVPLVQERPEGVAHRVGQEEHRQNRQHRVTREYVARSQPRHAVYALLADYVDQRVEERQQHDQGGYDPRYETDEGLAAGLEQPDEQLARGL